MSRIARDGVEWGRGSGRDVRLRLRARRRHGAKSLFVRSASVKELA